MKTNLHLAALIALSVGGLPAPPQRFPPRPLTRHDLERLERARRKRERKAARKGC